MRYAAAATLLVRTRHAWVLVAFMALSIAWTYPLATRMSSHILGADAGDNVLFVWNFWWTRVALAEGHSLFYTPYLFAPAGTDLLLHTHTVVPALIGATLLGTLPTLLAHNVYLIAAVALNAFAAYLLALHVTRSTSSSVCAGIVYGGSPFIAAHLHGHLNLTTAWTLPLIALTAARTVASGSMTWAVAAALLIGLTAYIDYYYALFGVLLTVVLIACELRPVRLSFAGRPRRSTRAITCVSVLLAVCALVLVAIAVTGGVRFTIGGVRVSATTGFNVLQVFWGLLCILAALIARPRVSVAAGVKQRAVRLARPVAALTLVVAGIVSPLAWHGYMLFVSGEYVTQRYLWRSAPSGIDLATVFLGNPFSAWWGGWSRLLHERFAIDMIESSAWVGVVPLLLCVRAVRHDWHNRDVRRWSLVGALFFVWSLGPHLMVFGVNTGFVLPQALLRYVPVISNARIPGRAVVLVYLALAVLSAIAMASLTLRLRRPAAIVGALLFALLIDYSPPPFPIIELNRPPLYETLRDRPERGSVVELPLGVRDGFGERGVLDERVLFQQTIHERPIVGGFVARLSPAIRQYYEDDALLAGFLDLSEGRPAADHLPRAAVAERLLRRNGVRFVVLDRRTASPALVTYVETDLPLELIGHDERRSLYVTSEQPDEGPAPR